MRGKLTDAEKFQLEKLAGDPPTGRQTEGGTFNEIGGLGTGEVERSDLQEPGSERSDRDAVEGEEGFEGFAGLLAGDFLVQREGEGGGGQTSGVKDGATGPALQHFQGGVDGDIAELDRPDGGLGGRQGGRQGGLRAGGNRSQDPEGKEREEAGSGHEERGR